MKFSWKSYWRPTPVIIKKAADSMLAAATLFSTYSYATENKQLACIIMIVSVLAKFLSNFFEALPPAEDKPVTE